MKTQVIYFLDSLPGETVEEKAYGVIASAYDEAGYVSTAYESNFAEAKEVFRIPAATLVEYGKDGGIKEWEVTVAGHDRDIEEYQKILKQVE